ncbi:hypothetical protein Lser_V15G38539 [Lactuca serriola]
MDSEEWTAEGRLPDAEKGASDLRAKFNRMGLCSDRDIVVLWGGHILDRAQEDRSDFDGPWIGKPLKFDNSYFKELLKAHKDEFMKLDPWALRGFQGKSLVNLLNEEPEGLLLLPSDRLLMTNAWFRLYVITYAKNPNSFLEQYAISHKKLSELGFIKRPPFPLYYVYMNKKNNKSNMLPQTIAGLAIAASVMIIWYRIRRSDGGGGGGGAECNGDGGSGSDIDGGSGVGRGGSSSDDKIGV